MRPASEMFLIYNDAAGQPRFAICGSGDKWGRLVSIRRAKPQPPRASRMRSSLQKPFLDVAPPPWIWANNIFTALSLGALQSASKRPKVHGIRLFVQDPERYGVVQSDGEGRSRGLLESGEPPSNYA